MLFTFEIQLLDKIQTPIINKFYDTYRVKGRANKQDDVWVVRYNNEIIAACRIQNISGSLFLSTLFVVELMRGKGVAKALISHVVKHYQNTQFSNITTFAYTHLTGLYISIGFLAPEILTKELAKMYHNYQNQGRKISALSCSMDTFS